MNATITHTSLFSADNRTAFREYAAYAIITLNCIQAGSWQQASRARRPLFGRMPGYVGKVVCNRLTGRYFAVNAETSHAVETHPLVWVNGKWQVVVSKIVMLPKYEIEVQ